MVVCLVKIAKRKQGCMRCLDSIRLTQVIRLKMEHPFAVLGLWFLLIPQKLFVYPSDKAKLSGVYAVLRINFGQPHVFKG